MLQALILPMLLRLFLFPFQKSEINHFHSLDSMEALVAHVNNNDISSDDLLYGKSKKYHNSGIVLHGHNHDIKQKSNNLDDSIITRLVLHVHYMLSFLPLTSEKTLFGYLHIIQPSYLRCLLSALSDYLYVVLKLAMYIHLFLHGQTTPMLVLHYLTQLDNHVAMLF